MNSDFVDVDFTQDPNYSAGFNGYGDVERFGSYGDSFPTYPEKDWESIAGDLGVGCDDLVTRIFDQKQEGSCVANATSQGVEIVQCQQFGRTKVVHLSAMSLYKQIGTGPSSGANVGDAWDAITKTGILPLDDEANKKKFPHFMPNTGWSTKYPDGWKETAKLFTGQEGFMINSLEEGISASFNRHPVIVGRSGHSICYARVVFKDGKLMMKYANSWGAWGDNGFGYDSMSMMKSALRGAFAICSVTYPTFRLV